MLLFASVASLKQKDNCPLLLPVTKKLVFPVNFPLVFCWCAILLRPCLRPSVRAHPMSFSWPIITTKRTLFWSVTLRHGLPNGTNVLKSGPFLPLFGILSVPPHISAVFRSG